MKTMISGVACAAVMLGAALAVPAHAMSNNKDSAIDVRGNTVVDRSGACVRTRWDVGMDPCAAKAPVVQAAAPAPAPKKVLKEHNRSYLVFFDFDRSNLTDNAKQVLADIYGKTQGSKSSSFEIIGHADRSGSDSYNLKLSEKRASSVKTELQRLGATAGTIASSWKGESEPLVPTKDGIREPQNRRAEIKVRSEVVEMQ